MPIPKSEQVIAKENQIKSIETMLDEYLNAHLDLIVAFYRDNFPPKTDIRKAMHNS